MAKNKGGSKILQQRTASGRATPNPSVDTLVPPAQDLPDIPTPVETQAQQRPNGTTSTTNQSSANTTTTEANPEAAKSPPRTQPSDIPLPSSTMMNSSEELPNLNNTSESATSSASPSRTATPATAAYDTAGYETPMASRTPSPRSIRPSVGAAVRRTLNIDWPLNMVVNTKGELPSIMISLIITTAPPAPTQTSFEYIPPVVFETTSPAAIEALANFLDQPGGHDVVFCFPDRKHLYADRYVLQRASPHFRHLFAVRNRESGIVPGVGVAVGPTMGDGKSALADDSDVEATPTREAGEFPRGRRGSGSSSRSRRMSERDITTIAGSTVLTPMTSVHSDSVQDPQSVPLPIDTKGFMFQRTTSPLMDDNVFVMNINETSFNTFRAFLYYLYTGFISFSPLTSSFQFPDQPNPWSPGKESTLELRRLEARNVLVGEYMRKYPNRPVPVSPKSIYQVARKYEVPSLEAQALSRINTATFNPLVATAELFSAFTRVHDSIKHTQLQVVIDNWNEVVKTEDWAIAKEKGKAQPDPYFAGVLCEILEALPPRSGL
ncbi:hypothetical protein FS837_001510 [Tulasnella sp. UAMH 9824]|nr:hypothetical protein FS837_001510 [Tulasnella sp. UAMH 9824]